ncbi:MAG: MGMT family protein [Sphingobacteriales bacterium]|nr:MAG: MGMT family protein [Sphingobacteriales bacterium]
MIPTFHRPPDLYEAVYEIVRAIPEGRLTSYGAIAAALGVRSGARMVGYAMNLSHTAHPKVPAHRVLNRNGQLTGKHHFGTPDAMQKLLEAEGIRVVDDAVPDFTARFWDPSQELRF